jgi:hypothetical protein
LCSVSELALITVSAKALFNPIFAHLCFKFSLVDLSSSRIYLWLSFIFLRFLRILLFILVFSWFNTTVLGLLREFLDGCCLHKFYWHRSLKRLDFTIWAIETHLGCEILEWQVLQVNRDASTIKERRLLIHWDIATCK